MSTSEERTEHWFGSQQTGFQSSLCHLVWASHSAALLCETGTGSREGAWALLVHVRGYQSPETPVVPFALLGLGPVGQHHLRCEEQREVPPGECLAGAKLMPKKNGGRASGRCASVG